MKRSVPGFLVHKRMLLSVLSLLLLASPFAADRAQAAEFYWNTGFHLSQEYNDNIYLENDSEDPEDDWITVLSQSFTLGIRTEEFDTALNFSIGYAHYQEREDSGDIRGDIDLSGFRDIPITENWILSLDESFSITEDPIEFGPAADPDQEPYYSSHEERTRYYRNRFRGELAYPFGEGNAFYWGYGNSLLQTSSDTIQDSMQHRPFAGVRYGFGVRHAIDLGMNYTKAEFDQTQRDDEDDVSDFDGWGGSASYLFRMDPETNWSLTYSIAERDFESEADSDYRTHNFSLGLTRQLSETLSASAHVGYFWQEVDDGESNSGPSASLSLSKQFEVGTLQLSGSMGIREQYIEAQNLGASEYRRVQASYGFQAAENLNVSLGAGWFENEYLQAENRTDDSTWYGNASLSYQVLEWLNTRLTYTHHDRNADVEEDEYKVNRVMLMFSIPYEGEPVIF